MSNLTKKEQHALLMSIGYTAEEALQLLGGKQEPAVPAEPAAPADPAAPAEPAAPAGQAAFDMAPLTKAIGDGFQMLKEQMIANNILGSRQHENTETADDIIANIIGPWQPPKQG